VNDRNDFAALRRLGGLLLLGAGLALPAGCDGGPKRYHVSGQVLHDGKPVPAGEIFFDPDPAKGNDGPQGFARIKDGRYDSRDGGTAAGPGPQVVRILGFDGNARPDADQPFGKALFPEYRTSADVPKQDATFNFQIPARVPAR
jgi:hypothetical protein